MGLKKAYILVKGQMSVTAANATYVSFKNSAPFTKYISKINGTIIDGADDLDLVMLMCNLIQYSSNYLKKQDVYGVILKT